MTPEQAAKSNDAIAALAKPGLALDIGCDLSGRIIDLLLSR